MDPMHYNSSTRSRSDSTRDSAAGSIVFLVLFGAAVLAASYPWLTGAAAAGAVLTVLARRGFSRLRRYRPSITPARKSSSGADPLPSSSPKR